MCSADENESVNFQTLAYALGYLSTHFVNSKIGKDVRLGRIDKVSNALNF